jgi:cytochrome P450
VTRSPNAHVSFGGGPHGCLGAMLARIETAAALDALLSTFESIELASSPRRNRETRLRAFAAIPISARPYLQSA